MLSLLQRGVLVTPQLTHWRPSFGLAFSVLLNEYGKDEGETFGIGKYDDREVELLEVGETGELEFGDGGVGGWYQPCPFVVL